MRQRFGGSAAEYGGACAMFHQRQRLIALGYHVHEEPNGDFMWGPWDSLCVSQTFRISDEAWAACAAHARWAAAGGRMVRIS
jgi:hypothetical protein